MKYLITIALMLSCTLVTAQQQWVKNTFPGQGHVDNPGPWKTGQGYDRAEWISAFGVSPVIPPGDAAPLMLQVTDLSTLQYSSDGVEFKRTNMPLSGGAAVAFNPHDGNVGYALMEKDRELELGGWWRTEDKGETWEFMVRAPTVRGQRNTLFEVHPATAFKDHLYMVASIPADSRIRTDFSDFTPGLYRSTDNGATWSSSPIDFADEEIYQISFNSDGSVLYVLTYAGGTLNRDGGNLYALTFDAADPSGTTYNKTLVSADVRNMDASPTTADEGVLLDNNRSIYSFSNFGANTSLLTTTFNNNSDYFFIEINPSNSQHIVCYGFGRLRHDPFIWTNDGGTTWNGIEEDEAAGIFPTWFDYAPINHFSTDYVYTHSDETILDGAKDIIGFWPGDPQRVLNWGTNIQKGPLMSEDYGRTFKPFAHGGSFKQMEDGSVGENSGVIGLAKNEYGFVLTKNNGVSWEGHSILNTHAFEEIYENHPSGRTFERRNPISLDFNPTNNDIIIGTYAFNPTFIVRSEDFGKTWVNIGDQYSFRPTVTEDNDKPENERRATRNAGRVFWHNQNANIVYAGPMKSTDGGLTFSKMPNGHFATNIHEKNGDIVLSLEFNRRIFLSYDAGDTWGEITKAPPSIVDPTSGSFVAVTAGQGGVAFDLRDAHDPTQGNQLRMLFGGENGVYEFLADAPGSYTGTWRQITNGFDFSDDPYYDGTLPGNISRIAVDKREGSLSTMYATVGGTRGRRSYYRQVYQSTDAGENWTKIASDAIAGSPQYISSLWSEVDVDGNFLYDDADGLYMYRSIPVIDAGANFPERGSVSGSGTYAYTDQVQLSAQPAQGFRFGGWEENGAIVNNDADWSFYTYLSRNLTAVFEVFNAPVDLATSTLTPESMSITWEAPADNPENVGIAGFNVYLEGNLIGSTGDSFFDITGLTEGTTYSVTVEAFSTAGSTSPLSTALVVSTPILDVVAPSVPTGLTSLNLYSTTAEVAWQASVDPAAYRAGVAGYRVYLDGNLVNADVSETRVLLTGLSTTTAYTFSVSAFDSVGNVSAISASASFTTTAADVEAPTIPEGFVALDIDYLSFGITWEEAEDNEYVTGYNVYLDGTLQCSTETTAFAFSDLRPDRTYAVEVEAFDLTRNTSDRGSFSVGTRTRTSRIEVDTEEEILFFLPRLNAGDSLVLDDGLYELGTQFPSNRIGTSTAPIVIMSKNLYRARITGNTRLQFTNCDYLKFVGLGFEDITQYTGLRLLGCNYATVSQCSFIATFIGSANTGLRIESNSNDGTRNAYNTIENCLFENLRFGSMIFMRNNPANVGGHVIKNNVYRASSTLRGNGLLLSTTGANVSNITVEGNVFDSWTSFDAINLQGSNNIIRKNVFTQSNGIVFRSGNDNRFEQNHSINSNGYALWLHGERHEVLNNIFEGGSTNAIQLTIASSGRAATKDNLIAHNAIVGARGFMNFAAGTGELPSGNRILNNVASNSAGQFLRDLPTDAYTDNTIDYNVFHNAGAAQPITLIGNNIDTDPLFGMGPYYLLGEGSSAIGTGTAVAEVSGDFFDNTRVNADRGHVAYPSDISAFVSPYMFYPPSTAGFDGLALEAVYDLFNANEQTGDIVMLDARESKGDIFKYIWTIKNVNGTVLATSGAVDESVYSFVYDANTVYRVILEVIGADGSSAIDSSYLRGVNVPINNLQLTSLCSSDPAVERRWRVRNNNDFPVAYTWEVYGTDHMGSGMALPGDNLFYTPAVGGANTTIIRWQNENGIWKQTIKASSGAACGARRAKPAVPMFAVFPNPANDFVNLSTQAEGTLNVYDMNGRRVLSQSLSGEAQLELSSFNAGVYLFQFQEEAGKVHLQRLLLNK